MRGSSRRERSGFGDPSFGSTELWPDAGTGILVVEHSRSEV